MLPPHARNTGRRPAVRWSAIALAAAALLLSACGGDSDGSGNDSVAHVAFTAADGAKTSVTDFHGKPLVVNMWATWCTPCVKEMPAFDEVAGEQSAVAIIGVNVGDTADAATAFAAGLGITYPQFTDPDGELSTAMKVTGYPATAFFDADGKLLNVHQGAFTAEELRTTIAQLYPDAATEGT